MVCDRQTAEFGAAFQGSSQELSASTTLSKALDIAKFGRKNKISPYLALSFSLSVSHVRFLVPPASSQARKQTMQCTILVL